MNKAHRMKAIECFEAAVRKDPKFAAAYAGIADSYQWLGYSMQFRAREVYSKAVAAIDTALDLEPNLAYARAVRGFIRFAFDWNWSGAEREFLRAIELDPADPAPHQKYSYFLTAMNRHRESLEQGRIAIDLDPLDAALHAHYAWAYLLLPVPDNEKAQLACNRALELDPVSPPALWFSAMGYEISGEFDQAAQRLEQLGYPKAYVQELREATAKSGAQGYWSTRQKTRADAYLAEIRKAMMACGMREKNDALDYLERAYEEREPQLAHMYNCPYLRALRGEARFERLADKVGVPRPA